MKHSKGGHNSSADPSEKEKPSHQKYACPMHPEIVQDGPGRCPKCGMNLVPVKAETGESIPHHKHSDNNAEMDHTGNNHEKMVKADVKKDFRGFQKYTCPMHPQIVQDGPGNCPLCGMTLVPLATPRSHSGHESHTSGIADFRKRFYVVLILTIPVMLL